jgi:hypothetical protein
VHFAVTSTAAHATALTGVTRGNPNYIWNPVIDGLPQNSANRLNSPERQEAAYAFRR